MNRRNRISSLLDVWKLSTGSSLESSPKNVIKQRSELPKRKDVCDRILSSPVSNFLHEDFNIKISSFFKQIPNNKIKYSFVVDEYIAEDIVKKILQDLKDDECNFVEGNPGIGLLTYYLLKSKVPKIDVYEDSYETNLVLKKLLLNYPNRLTVSPCNIFDRSEWKTFSQVINKPVDPGTIIKFVGVVPNYSFFSGLVRIIAIEQQWEKLLSRVFYVVVSDDVMRAFFSFENTPVSFYSYCLFNLFFDYQKMGSYPRNSFLPYSKYSDKEMHLLKVYLNYNFYENFNKRHIKAYCNFIKVVGRKQHGLIIPTIEKWIPDCGPYLICKGISVSQRTVDLTPLEFLKLFYMLKSYIGSRHMIQIFDSLSEN